MTEKPRVPHNLEDLASEIAKLIASVEDPNVTLGIESDGYGKCVEAMWRAAYMAHELVASRLGVTGFQHGMSSLHLLGALRSLEGPYMIVDASQALYPQYDLVGKVQNFLAGQDVCSWLAREASKKLDDAAKEPEFNEWTDENGEAQRMRNVHPTVEAHWKRLAEYAPTEAAAMTRPAPGGW